MFGRDSLQKFPQPLVFGAMVCLLGSGLAFACRAQNTLGPVPCSPTCEAGEVCDDTEGVCRAACASTADCPDGEACVLSTYCLPANAIVSCSDGDPCTENDVELGGACIGEPVVCDAGGVNTLGECDPEGGSCIYRTLGESACGDGDDNDGDGAIDCEDQDCLVNAPRCAIDCDNGGDCPDEGDCVEWSCVSGTCRPSVLDGATCDIDACAHDGTCDANGQCQEFQIEEPDPNRCPFNPNNICKAAICVDDGGEVGCAEGDVDSMDGQSCGEGSAFCDGGKCVLEVGDRCDNVPGYVVCPAGSACNENYDGNSSFCVSAPDVCAYVENVGEANENYEEVASGDYECALSGGSTKSKECSDGTWGSASCRALKCGAACTAGSGASDLTCRMGDVYRLDSSCSSTCEAVEDETLVQDCMEWGCLPSGNGCYTSCTPGSDVGCARDYACVGGGTQCVPK